MQLVKKKGLKEKRGLSATFIHGRGGRGCDMHFDRDSPHLDKEETA